MESIIEGNESLWTRGQFILNNNLLSTPRRVVICPSKEVRHLSHFSNVSCIAICKRGCLQTQPVDKEAFQVPSYENCRYPNVILAECYLKEPLDDSGQFGIIQYLPEVYYSLHVCANFLQNYSFYENEIVWFRSSEPYPLDKIYLTLSSDNSLIHDTPNTSIQNTLSQVYQNCNDTTIIFDQRFKFIHQLSTNNKQTTPEEEFLSSNYGSSCSPSDPLPPVTFDVLGTTPFLQGKLTSKTHIIVVSSSDSSEESTVIESIEKTEDIEDDDDDVLYHDPLQRYNSDSSRVRSVSLSSASDLKFEVSGPFEPPIEENPSMSLSQVPNQPSRLILEALPATSHYRLQYHFILLPKEQARQFHMFDLQNVLIKTYSASPAHSRTHSIKDMVIQLNNDLVKRKEEEQQRDAWMGWSMRKHLAIVRVYDNERELEMLLPQLSLGRSYTINELSAAYLHPELFFTLFPETLSLTPRRYLIEIENMMTTPISGIDNVPLNSSIKTNLFTIPSQFPAGVIQRIDIVYLSIAGTINMTYPLELKKLIKEYLMETQNKLVVNVGDVFSLVTDYGRLMLRVQKIDPETKMEDGGLIDENIVFCGRSHTYLPHLISPSPTTPISSYWEEIRPPGLEDYCHTLFSHFLPQLTPGVHPQSRCTLVLMSGPPGVGKRTVIRAVAKQCRLNVLEFNCFDLNTDIISNTETRMRICFDQAVIHAPCVLILKEIQILTNPGSTHDKEEEPRLAAAFERFVATVSEETNTSNFPVIIVGLTTNVRYLSSRIQQCFLHEMVLTPPTLDQRLSMIRSLSHHISVSVEVDLSDIAQRTAGYVLGDFVTLFSHAKQLALQNYIKDPPTDGTRYCLQSQDIAISGVLICSDHMEKSLDKLHTLHSGYIGAPKIPQVRWEDVGGLETAKKEILETIQLPLLHPELFAGGLRRSGILLYGAPGTGKTLLAKAVATECSLNFISVKGPELINMYVGQTEENIREVFTRARGAAPCVVFFDELDSIAPNRGKSGDSGGVMDRVVSQLLAELDGMDKTKDVFVIGATNRPDLIDPALLRPGRFDRLVYLDVCEDTQSKLVILKAITRKFNLHDDVNLEELANACPSNVTGADLYSLCADAMLSALRKQINVLEQQGKGDDEWEGTLMVYQEDFLSALNNLTPSVTKEELEKYRDKKSFTTLET